MALSDLAALAEKLTQRVLCVGDAMIDHYVRGRVERISPEAPVPVLHIESEESRLGGAGNVLRNLHALGVETCFISATGNDTAGGNLSRLVAELGTSEAHVIAERGRTTTVKTRYIAETQQLLRTDREEVAPLKDELRGEFIKLVRAALIDHRVAIVSDYAKGVLANGLAGEIVAAARELIAAHDFAAMLVSCGKDGMVLVERDGAVNRLPAGAHEVYDVSGAGDTVVAVVGAALAAGGSLLEAAQLANIAAGIVVGKVGTAVVTADELAQALVDRDALEHIKAASLALALEHVARWRRHGLTIGFTNGCFDLLHPGHVALLRQARAGCDRLVVGLNSDASVRRLKGSGRPVQNADARSEVLTSLASVDLVVVFEEDTPLALIEAIRPDLLVKGADYRAEEVVGGALVEAYGGKVLLAELVPGFSTTATIARAAG